MPKNTLCNLVNCEAMLSLHFHAHSVFHAFNYTFLNVRYTSLNSCYTSSALTLFILCTSATLPAIPCLSHFTSTIASCRYLMAPMSSRQCSLVGIEINNNCIPKEVRLAIHMHRRSHKHTQHIQAFDYM